ncbi:serine/threonine protein kinase [Massilia sp. R2A-15]|uniref:protein kinase domain-containing protein n=1 Tax=Massilia sp. R2A-15 TaxID=3064278 RepID=UPI002732D6D2|nr:protein kinase [Massilia sp. R2A-15]WLI90945.1 serine/threonine protein kinase [Massilia sp. R2A-15]
MLDAGAVITLEAGAYRLRAPLARSAYGVVWCADALPAGRQVALKLINREQMARARPEQRERWIASASKEIAFLRSLAPWDERHIVRLLDSGMHDGLPVMALELLDADVASHVARLRRAGGAIGFGQALSWLGQINDALAKVHQYGWRYLDLKPSNVLLDTVRGGVKLTDFGTNRLLGEAAPHGYAGTANWQAPEQFFPDRDGRYHTDTRSDYFALGAMFYYLVTGGLPLRFCSDCGQAYREHQAGGAAFLLASHGGAMPPTLRDDEAVQFAQRAGEAGTPALALLRRLLSADRHERPPHALAISRMIADVRSATTVSRAA